MLATSDRCAECAVRDVSLCAGLADHELEVLNSIGHRKTIPSGQVIAWEGDDSAVCANVVSGVLKATNSTLDGREQIVGLLFAGDFLGQPFRDTTTLTITALSDAELCIYPRRRFEQALTDHAKLERLLLQRTLASLDNAQVALLSLGRRNAGERVAGFLLEIAARAHICADAVFILPLSRGQIADVLGMTIETVSRQLTLLKSAGLVALPHGREVAILDRKRLEAFAGNP